MNSRQKHPNHKQDLLTESSADASLKKVSILICVVSLCIILVPSLLLAQDGDIDPERIDPGEALDESVYDPEDAVQESGMDGETGLVIGDVTDRSYELSPGEDENIRDMMEGLSGRPNFEFGEAFDLSAGEGEPFELSVGEGEAFDLSIGEGDLFDFSGEDEEFALPPIESPDLGEIFSLDQPEIERTIFSARPSDQYYQDVVTGASRPDITRLGPLPEIIEEGIEFTDVAADWIYHQKSAGLTELRGYVMILYDTTIISCDEAVLDEMKEVYRFFGEGRVFVDDVDFTLECDELEIHDAEDEKMIYIIGRSDMVVYADEDAEEPGEDASRRERLDYALKQQDTLITFTDAEYDYENDIFDAHGGVRFEQSDKYAEGDEFHGENETEYALFTGNCEFWQVNGQWLYEYRVIEDEDDPPSRGDKITRALLSVPTTITSDEFEAEGMGGWLQLRSYGGNVVYFHQDDKHAECESFTLWYSEDEEIDQEEIMDDPAEPPEYYVPPGFGALCLAKDFPPDYVPWTATTSPIIAEGGSFIETAIEIEPSESEGIANVLDPAILAQLEALGISEDIIKSVHPSYLTESITPEQIEELIESGVLEEYGITSEMIENLDLSALWQSGDSEETESPAGSLAELSEEAEVLVTRGIAEDEGGPRNEIIMSGNVFIRQENGDWLFEYDIVNEEEETEENIEQYRKWANGSCDYLHVWTRDDLVEATGSVVGEQDNQDLTCDFLRYIGDLDMLYIKGNVIMHREGKHQLMSNEGFLFFSTNIFEALGQVRTTVMVDVEEQRGQDEGEAVEGESEGGDEEESEVVEAEAEEGEAGA